MRAGKHVQVEIPLADRWPTRERVAATPGATGLVCMVGHTRRFNPSHQWIHQRVVAGELNVLQMDVQTYFFRRTNMNALGHRAVGPTTCFGTTPRTPSTSSPTSAAPTSSKRTRSPVPIERRTRHPHGHVDPIEDVRGPDLHALAELQQRGPPGHVLPLHR